MKSVELPINFYNIRPNFNTIQITLKASTYNKPTYTLTIPNGNYTNITDILTILNNQINNIVFSTYTSYQYPQFVLNSNNIVQDGQNNKLLYQFPNSVLFKANSIAVSSVSMYYSWFNISSALGNNTFTYSWTSGTTTTTYSVVIPDGLYEIAQLNSYFQFVMISNDTYLIDSSGKYVYYAELILNPTRYAVQLNTLIFHRSFFR